MSLIFDLLDGAKDAFVAKDKVRHPERYRKPYRKLCGARLDEECDCSFYDHYHPHIKAAVKTARVVNSIASGIPSCEPDFPSSD